MGRTWTCPCQTAARHRATAPMFRRRTWMREGFVPSGSGSTRNVTSLVARSAGRPLAVLSLTGAAIVVLAGVAERRTITQKAGWFAGAAIANGLFAFALLRAVALHLHMAVDRIMVEGVED